MRRTFRIRIARGQRELLAHLLSVIAAAFFVSPTRAQSDDFNAGTDTGWTRYDPLAPFGYATTYAFPNGGYRIDAPGTGDPAVGPGRAGSLREDRTYTAFQFSVDIVNWDTSRPQAIGLLARATNPGLLTTDAYALTYSTTSQTLDLSRMGNEYLTSLASVRVPINSAQSLHLVFVGAGVNLFGEILDGADLAAPLASLRTTDASYDHGYSGLYVLDSGDGNHGAAATFDNYINPIVSADANLDGKVDFSDLVTLARHYGTTNATWSDGDFNADGIVDFNDLVTLARSYGQSTPAQAAIAAHATEQLPEPGSLMFVCAVVLLRRRRRR